jgi:hypothetical protein
MIINLLLSIIMKTILYIFAFLCFVNTAFSQIDTFEDRDTNTYRIVKTDGGELIGKILSKDAREVHFLTSDNREIYIPQHTIKEIILVQSSDFNAKGQFIGEDRFATRYFLTTNGLPMKKGEHYVQWNLFGPNFQFELGSNFGVGIMTSWVGIPIIGTFKKSWEIGKKTQVALGGLIGTGSWAAPDVGGALPFGTLSFGNRSRNLALSGGYGAIWYDGAAEGRGLASIAGMIKVSSKISLVFDSFILLPGQTEIKEGYDWQYVYNPISGQNEWKYGKMKVEKKKPGFAILIPGLRWHQDEGKALQIGFSGVIAEGEVVPLPIPMIQWYRSF